MNDGRCKVTKAKSRRNTKVGRGYLQNAYVYMGEAFRGTHSTEDLRLVRLDVAAAHHRRCLAALRPGVLATWLDLGFDFGE